MIFQPGAGTVEYLYNAQTNRFYFLELNPRLQAPRYPPWQHVRNSGWFFHKESGDGKKGPMDDRDVGFLQMFIFIFERKTFFLMFYLNQRCRFLTKGKLKFDTYDIIVLSWKFFRESQTLSDQCMVYLNIFNPKLPKSWVILDLPVVVKVFHQNSPGGTSRDGSHHWSVPWQETHTYQTLNVCYFSTYIIYHRK